METKLLTLREYSLSYNQLFTETEVKRDYILDDIEELSANDAKLIIIEGNQGIGKSNLLLQFANRHKSDCLTYFINPAFRLTFKLDYLMEDLGKQMLFLNTAEPPEDELSITEGIFNKLILDLIKTPKRKNKPIFFILDGLDQIDKSDIELLKSALHNLPWGANYFYFIVSGDLEKLKNILPGSATNKAKTIRVPRFSIDETSRFFGFSQENQNEYIKEIYATWKGHPEQLSQVKRILDSGIDLKDFLLKDDIREKNDLLEVEWNQSSVKDLGFNSDIIKMISIIALDDNTRSIVKIADIIQTNEASLNIQINDVSFLMIKNGEVSFVSSSYRQFVANKLLKYESNVSSLLIEYFTQKEGIDSVVSLPTLFEKKKEWSRIIDLLSIDNLGLIISSSKSFAEINKQLNFGFTASNNLKKSFNDILKFSLYRSSVKGLQRSDARESQIEAYIALDKQEEAFSLISNAVLKEDRLKMLIWYVKESKIRKKNVDNLVIKDIEDLLIEIDPDYLKENLVDIVTGLAHFLPEKAVQLIEKASGVKSEKGSLEWLLGYVAMVINKNKAEDGVKATSKNDERSVNEVLDKFSKSIGYGINDINENDIMEAVSKIENVSDRLYMIRTWIKKNSDVSNIHEIIDFALSLLLQSSSIVKPTTTMLLDIASPIQNLRSRELVETLINRIDDLMLSISTPTCDKIRLQILIIEVIIKYDSERSNQRAFELFSYVEDLSDFSLKTEALSYCWTLVKRLEQDPNINSSDFILEEDFIKKEIISAFVELLRSTSDHYKETKNTIEVLADTDVSFALELSEMLNTVERRSYAVLNCIKTHVDKDIETWNIVQIQSAVSSIEIDTIYTKAIVAIFDAAYDQRDIARNFRTKIKDLLPLIDKALGNTVKCYLLTKAILLLRLEPKECTVPILRYDKLIEKLKKFQLNFWNKIDSPWEKISVGYSMCSELAEYDSSLANEYFIKAKLQAQECLIDNRTHAAAFIHSIRLMIRVFCGMLIKDKNYSYEKISGLISHLPSQSEQAELWSELAVRANLVGASIMTEDIVNNKILPIIENYKKGKEQFYYCYIVKVSATAIYLAQPATLELYLDSIPANEKEDIVSSICYVILTKGHDSDPYDDDIGSSKFTYQDAINYLELLNKIESDHILFHHIRNLCHIGKTYSTNFVREQKTEIKQRLLILINSKFPNKKTGINHYGYAIVAEACVQHFSLDHSNSTPYQKVFEDLNSRVSDIPNTADRSFVFSILSSECEHKKKKLDFLNSAFEEANKILSTREKIQMYENALKTASKFAPDIFNDRIKQIREEIFKLDESEMFPTFRKLIDLAFKHDKPLAQRLISSLDTDPGRIKLSEPATDHFEKLDLEKSVLSDYSQFNKIKNRRHMGSIAWKMLGQLNSDKRNTREVDQTIQILRTASRVPFMYSAPLFEFFLQNAIKHDNSANTLLPLLYTSTYYNAELCYRLICSISNKNSSSLAYRNTESDSTYFVRAGHRNEAFEFLGKIMKVSGSMEIYIIDPYFSEKDVHLLKSISEWCYGSNITVITSTENNGDFSRFAYYSAWATISSEEPPQTLFIRVSALTPGSSNMKSPFHDRWIIMYDKLSGINLGTSINSIGNKASRISSIDTAEVQSIHDALIIPLAKEKVREHEGKRMLYETFDF